MTGLGKFFPLQGDQLEEKYKRAQDAGYDYLAIVEVRSASYIPDGGQAHNRVVNVGEEALGVRADHQFEDLSRATDLVGLYNKFRITGVYDLSAPFENIEYKPAPKSGDVPFLDAAAVNNVRVQRAELRKEQEFNEQGWGKHLFARLTGQDSPQPSILEP